MAKTQPNPSLPGNRLLARLPADEYQRLFPDPRPVPLEFKHVLYEPEIPIEFAYFPSHGVVSEVTVMEDGASIELSTVGNEGMVGLPVPLGIAESSSKAVVQVPGSGLRLPVDKLRVEISRDTPLRRLLLRYTGLFLFQVSQTVACNGLHSVQQRCCRWLLMTHDRVDGDEFPITHEFLAQMLGVRRPSISEVLRPLQKDGLIRYHRGRMVILDRESLEATSCECHRTVQREYARLLGSL
jgi:CRP-like cAMP-binding protein